MKIELYNNYQKEINFDFEKIIKDVETLDSNAEIALILVDIDEIHKINKEYRHKNLHLVYLLQFFQMMKKMKTIVEKFSYVLIKFMNKLNSMNTLMKENLLFC